MTILVTGATGTVGRNVVDQLIKRGADVRALVRDPSKANLPAGVADEFTQALIASIWPVRPGSSGSSICL